MTKEKARGKGTGWDLVRLSYKDTYIQVPTPRKLTQTYRLKIDSMCAIGCGWKPYLQVFEANP